MKSLGKLLTLGIYLVTSCQQASTTDRPATSKAESQPPAREEQVAGNVVQSPGKPLAVGVPAADTLHVIEDQLIERLLKTLDYKQRWPELRHSAKKFELTPGTDDPSIIDSIITYTISHNLFVYIKSGSADAGASIIRCQLTAPPLHLPQSIYLGMSRAALAQALGKKTFSADVVVVTEQEGYQRFYFVFENGFLRAVNFESYYMG